MLVFALESRFGVPIAVEVPDEDMDEDADDETLELFWLFGVKVFSIKADKSLKELPAAFGKELMMRSSPIPKSLAYRLAEIFGS